MKLGEAIYKSQQKDAGKKDAKQNQDSKNKDSNKENVVDADFEEVKKKTQVLIQSSMKLGEAVYKSQQKDAGKKDAKQKQDSKNKSQDKENVVDADFEEVKEDKNDKNKDKDKEKRA